MAVEDAKFRRPSRRPLRIFPFDPMLDRGGRMTTVQIGFEELKAGPSGRLIEVIDYDGSRDRFYLGVDLDDPAVLQQGGLSPDESDPRFHQQMVYAVVMGVLEQFETALGRPFKWSGVDRLRVYPHAFERRNAYFDPELGALLFGYFRADKNDPGANIPNQTVFTCLSHSIVAHETTHAVLHRLRPHFSQATNPDVLAFHEGLADIVAMLLPFTYRDVVAGEISSTRGDLAGGGALQKGSALLELAAQFGYASGGGKALRTALNDPDPGMLERAGEPHSRGEILASAVVSGFLRAYRSDANSAIRLATSGSGVLAPGALHPDLVSSLSRAASKAASRLLNMCIRALDYLPPVDVTFGDYMRAVVTADADLFPNDDKGIRAGLIEGFRERGIYPTGAISLADRSVRVEPVPWRIAKKLTPLELPSQFVLDSIQEYERNSPNRDFEKNQPSEEVQLRRYKEAPTAKSLAQTLHGWAEKNRNELKLRSDVKVQVAGFHVSQRYDADSYIRNIVAVQFLQTEPAEMRPKDWGGLRRRGGTTVIADSFGWVRYIIARPLPRTKAEQAAHNEMVESYLDGLRFANPGLNWSDDDQWVTRNFNLAGIDELRF